MEPEDRPILHTVGTPPAQPPAPGAVVPLDRMRELVVDLVEETGLVAKDHLALVRGQLGRATLGEALVQSGLAASSGVARMLALQHGLPLVDLGTAGISAEATGTIPLHVLTRAAALPYRLPNQHPHVAISPPR